MKKVLSLRSLVVALAVLSLPTWAQKTLVEGALKAPRWIVGESVGAEVRGCWVHEGAVRCAVALWGTRPNATVSLGLRTADFAVTYRPEGAGSTAQSEPQTVRARMITELTTGDKGTRMDLSLELGVPVVLLLDFPVPPTVKSLAMVQVGEFSFPSIPVAEKIPSDTLLEVERLLPTAFNFQVGNFRLELVQVWKGDYKDRATFRFRVTNTGPDAALDARWGIRYFVNSQEFAPGLEWWCDAKGTLLKDTSTDCHLRLLDDSSYFRLKDNMIQLLEIRLNDEKRIFRNVRLSRLF